MKATLLYATLSMVLATPSVFAKSELETLRSLCSEQERQIRQLEDENSRMRGGSHEAHAPAARTEPVAAAKTAPTAPTASTYTVKAGDSLERIARKVGTSAQKLAKSNGMKASSMIHPGQKLKVPGSKAPAASPAAAATVAAPRTSGSSHKVQAGETFSSISRKHGISTGDLIAANPKVKPSSLRPGQVVSLGGDGPSTTMISTPAPRAKSPEAVASPPPREPVAKSPAVRENLPVSTATPAPAAASAPQAAATTETLSPNSEKKIRPVTIEGEMTYGEFATRHGTDAERLNALNGLDLTTATVLAKGSELYVPAQP